MSPITSKPASQAILLFVYWRLQDSAMNGAHAEIA
jgi:hypothetical protein